MSDPTDPAGLETARQTLTTFEQILEVMPNDRGTLEAALMAAHHCGEEEKALQYRLRLANQLAAEGLREELEELVNAIRQSDDPRAKEWLANHAQRAAPRVIRRTSEPLARTQSPAKATIDAEIDLAWMLLEHGDLTQDEYAAVVRDLTEISTAQTGDSVSVLHVLEAIQHKHLERIIDYLGETARTPFIELASFDIRAECAQFLTAPFIQQHGALVFELIGDELLVALLNPLNQALRDNVQQTTGRTCHFYLARASDFERAADKMLDAAATTG